MSGAMEIRRAHSVRARRMTREQNIINFVILALLCLNAAFVYLRQDDDIDEDSPLIRYSASSRRRARTAVNTSDINLILGEHVEKFSVPILRRHAIKGHGLQSFVLLGGYRTGPASFAAVGLAATFFRTIKTVQGCRWRSPGHSINGTLTMHYPGEGHELKYETLVLLCELTAADPGVRGGELTMTIDGEDMVAIKEKVAPKEALPVIRHNISVCTPPIHSPLHPTRLLQWIDFHRSTHTLSLFILYDGGGVDGAMREGLEPLVKKGWVEVHGVRQVGMYDVWEKGKILFANDCLYRAKQISAWALFLDFDEYLTFPPPTPTPTSTPTASLPSLLESTPHTPWMSFGVMTYSLEHCAPRRSSQAGWAIEQLLFREESVHCKEPAPKNRDLCLFSPGLRKFVANTKETLVVQTHRVMNPGKGGVHALASVVRINRYPGLAKGSSSQCQFWWEKGTSPPRLVQDSHVAMLAEQARRKEQKNGGWVWG